MDDTLIYISIDVKYDYNFCRSNYSLKYLDTTSFEPTKIQQKYPMFKANK